MKRKDRPTHFANTETGWRCVILVEEGRKWVTLRLPGKQRGRRMTRAAWDQMPKREIVRGKLSPAVS
jgi:hypothetical protein